MDGVLIIDNLKVLTFLPQSGDVPPLSILKWIETTDDNHQLWKFRPQLNFLPIFAKQRSPAS